MTLPQPLVLWTIRHKSYGFLTDSNGDFAKHLSIFSNMFTATRELLRHHDNPEEWEIVELREVQK
jgi:hypothetical protein